MKLIEPILFPVAPDILEVFKFAGMNNIKSFDIYHQIAPYLRQSDLYYNYIDPALLDKAVEELFNGKVIDKEMGMDEFIEYWLNKLDEIKSPYDKYYRLFLTKFIMIHPNYEKNLLSFKLWLENIHPTWNFTFKKCFSFKSLAIIRRGYNTLVIPRLWRKKEKNIIPWINLLHNSQPVYFNEEKIIKVASEHLLEGGRIYVLNPKDFWKVMYAVGNDYDIEDGVLTKKTFPKTKKITNKINWL